jgi:hypothetical protein
MKYKKIITSRRSRLIILKFLDFIPDRFMIYIQYYISTGRVLNLKNPRRFTEKLQWYKLYYRNKLMTKCADKYMVREYVISKGLKDILIRLYGVYDKADQINFKDLPNSFILKTTNGSHTNISCIDKPNLNIKNVKNNLNKWIEEWAGKVGREWAYYDINPKIICEKLLVSNDTYGLDDYKFFCFDGEPYCLYVLVDRESESGLRLGIYDLKFNKLKYKRSDIEPIEDHIEKPKNFEKMVEISRILSKDFPHVRVDLYNIDGKIYFGELTFYDGSGYKGFEKDEFDYLLGNKFKLPSKSASL